MKLLAIETATESCSVALLAGGEVIEYYQHAPRRHAELLLPWVQKILAEAEFKFSSLDAIAFSRGPGSFTSLRIGIGVVQGLAWASDLGVVPISSLAATAQTVVGQGINSTLVALDARMSEVFTGSFSVDSGVIMKPVSKERVCRPEDVQPNGDNEVFGLGAGFARYPALQELSGSLAGILPDTWPTASSVIELARDWLGHNEPLAAELAQPVYLRDNVAKKQQTGKGQEL
jgi:tRNA threonylcarbamoyladenosine biosynthesis protein TsaB